MVRTKSSKRWLKEHFSDPFVVKAQKDGYRSRAVYKLIELQNRYKIIKKNSTIVELGSAPGSWSQYIAEILDGEGKIVAVDLLDFDEIPGVDFIKGDFTSEDVYKSLMDLFPCSSVDCIVSDMLPNSTGIKKVDQLKSIQLVEEVIDFALKTLKCNGNLLVKVLQGPGFEEMVRNLRKIFCKVSSQKPMASRARSIEVYLLAIGFKND